MHLGVLEYSSADHLGIFRQPEHMGTQRHCLPELTRMCWPPYSYSQLLLLPINVKDIVLVWFLRLWYHDTMTKTTFIKQSYLGLQFQGTVVHGGRVKALEQEPEAASSHLELQGWSKECPQEMAGVFKLSETTSSEVCLLGLPQTAPPTGSQALKYPRLWETFFIQVTIKASIKMVMPQ